MPSLRRVGGGTVPRGLGEGGGGWHWCARPRPERRPVPSGSDNNSVLHVLRAVGGWGGGRAGVSPGGRSIRGAPDRSPGTGQWGRWWAHRNHLNGFVYSQCPGRAMTLFAAVFW